MKYLYLVHCQVLREASANYDESLRHQPLPQHAVSVASPDRHHRPFPMSFDERISGQSAPDDAGAMATGSSTRRAVTSQRKLQMNDPWRPMSCASSVRSAQTSPAAASQQNPREHPPACEDAAAASHDVISDTVADVSTSSSCVNDASDASLARLTAPAVAAPSDVTQERDDVTSSEAHA